MFSWFRRMAGSVTLQEVIERDLKETELRELEALQDKEWAEARVNYYKTKSKRLRGKLRELQGETMTRIELAEREEARVKRIR